MGDRPPRIGDSSGTDGAEGEDLAILHFLPAADDPAGTVACLRDAVAPGSYLAVSHIGTDFFPDKSALAEAVAV
jgi:hypothetical protein